MTRIIFGLAVALSLAACDGSYGTGSGSSNTSYSSDY